MLRLVKPGREYEEEILAFKREMEEAGNGDMEGCGGLNRVDSFDEWMEHLNAYADRNKIDPGTGYVEGSQYLLVEEDSHRILGMINLRHYLNDQLMRTSGHIGFSIRPGERRKGYGKTQLRQALEIIGAKGVTDALITCDEDNIASARTIEACGGILEKEIFVEEFHCVVKRYWVHIH